MYILLYGFPSKKDYPTIPETCMPLVHTELGQMLEDIRTLIQSEPCILISYEPLSPETVSHLNFCFPELFYIPQNDDIYQSILDFYSKIIRIFPKLSIRTDNLHYIEKTGRKIHFHYQNYYRSITSNMKNIPDLHIHGILRCHYSFHVNMNQIHTIQDNTCSLFSGQLIPISRTYLTNIKKYRKMQQHSPVCQNQSTNRQASPKLKKR